MNNNINGSNTMPPRQSGWTRFVSGVRNIFHGSPRARNAPEQRPATQGMPAPQSPHPSTNVQTAIQGGATDTEQQASTQRMVSVNEQLQIAKTNLDLIPEWLQQKNDHNIELNKLHQESLIETQAVSISELNDMLSTIEKNSDSMRLSLALNKEHGYLVMASNIEKDIAAFFAQADICINNASLEMQSLLNNEQQLFSTKIQQLSSQVSQMKQHESTRDKHVFVSKELITLVDNLKFQQEKTQQEKNIETALKEAKQKVNKTRTKLDSIKNNPHIDPKTAQALLNKAERRTNATITTCKENLDVLIQTKQSLLEQAATEGKGGKAISESFNKLSNQIIDVVDEAKVLKDEIADLKLRYPVRNRLSFDTRL